MPATRTVQRPNPVGHGSASVPVLFSLPNVQPAIAAAATGAAAQRPPEGKLRTEGPRRDFERVDVAPPQPPASFEPSAILVSPAEGLPNRNESWLNKLSSQLTNITIIFLLIAVLSLTYRNLQQSEGGKSSSGSVSLVETESLAPASPSPASLAPAAIPAQATRELPDLTAEIAREKAPAIDEPKTAQVAMEAPEVEPRDLEKGAIPLLLPPAPLPSPTETADATLGKPNLDSAKPSGPYGTASPPFSLTSSKNLVASGPSVPSPAPRAEGRTRADTMETDNPSLNTREIIRMRNGQRRFESGPSDPSLPRVESLSRPSGTRSPTAAIGGTPVMTGQSYPAIAPQYEPISLPTVLTPSSRIIQPTSDAPQKFPQKQYVPLSPVLPNPNEASEFDDGNP
jgi:hypothetical protein